MKSMRGIAVLVLLLVSFGGIGAQTAPKNRTTTVSTSQKVEVYYFHYTRRCVTCQAIEDEAKKMLPALYPSQYKSKKIVFTAVNLDAKESKALAKKFKVEGQSLLVISGNKRIDLTDQAFMYAINNPDKLKQTLKQTINPLLN